MKTINNKKKGAAVLITAAILALVFTGCPNNAGGSGGGTTPPTLPPADKTYTVGGVSFTMKKIAAVTNGTVWEWCWDWYSSTTPTGGQDPAGGGSGSDRVIRGGSWNYIADHCTVGGRLGGSPYGRDGILGFRLACRP